MVHESQVRRSCDRCYAIKERCSRTEDPERCDRCIRLNHVCAIERAMRRPGRPQGSVASRKLEKEVSRSCSPTTTASDSVSRRFEDALATVRASAVEKEFIRQCVLGDVLIEQFVIGPSFYDPLRKLHISTFCEAPEVLGDAHHAAALSSMHDQQLSGGGKTTTDLGSIYEHASKALHQLSSFQVRNAQDLRIYLALGSTAETFSMKLRAEDAHGICRQALSVARNAYYDDAIMAELSSDDICALSSLVLTDIAESLFAGHPPCLRYREPTDLNHVNPFVGISESILPLFCDLAGLNNKMTLDRAALGLHALVAETNSQELQNLEQALRCWRPNIPDDFITRFTAAETSHMICQAEVLRSAGLLILYRMQHPYGAPDVAAYAMALHLLTLLETTERATNSVPRCVDLPLTVACFEFSNDENRNRWLRLLSPISAYSDTFRDKTEIMLTSFRAACRVSPGLYWYEMSSVLPPAF